MGFQYMLSGITPGHGNMAIHAINVPVSVGGMDVSPGEIVHMDENGAVKFPANALEQVLANVTQLRDDEAARMGNLHQASTAAEVRAIFGGQGYAKK
jgi:regulator of RNase E activity RraA